ncbi:MAG: hypothetical protein EOO67_07095 [Microbacterium sp.]|nr:MAG: hypothetical protein EOO67_07095 [Microbacterium sp.]
MSIRRGGDGASPGMAAGKGPEMFPSAEHEPHPETVSMRVVFWIWTAVIAGGLVVMIAIPLTGV